MIFCFDQMGQPNLAQVDDNYDHHWPRVVPLRLLMYTDNYQTILTTASFDHAWYPIGIGWFDFSVDYFALMSAMAQEKLRTGKLTVLFYYHEGDNPTVIKQRIDSLVMQHQLSAHCYKFISANSSARHLDNFLYFPDHEFFFRVTNQTQLPVTVSPTRPYRFTAINRLHKVWRAACMSDLYHRGILDQSLWSYNTANQSCLDEHADNPLELDAVPNWDIRMAQFLELTPHYCDNLTTAQHNNHNWVNTDLYTQSYCHIVFETLYDVDRSGGAFITEKTWKAIKYGQPFVIVSGAGTLRALRDLGYRTFDSVINNTYDSIENNTDRWLAIVDTLKALRLDASWLAKCQSDIDHNQKHFDSRSIDPVNRLLEEIQCH